MAKIKILLVDDDPDSLEVAGEKIKGWGYDVIKAMSGKKAVEAVKSKLSDIVILDYKMPNMDGLTTLEEIRNIDGKIPVIMLTAYPNTGALKFSLELNATAFIPKTEAYLQGAPSLEAAIKKAEKKLSK